MVRCIIFDFGRVLGNFDHMKTCRKLAEFRPFSPEEIHGLLFKSGLEKQYDEGLDSGEFYRKVMGALQPREEIGMERFREFWGDIFGPNPGIERILERIRPGVRSVVLSNTNEIHWDYVTQLDVLKRFFRDENSRVLSFRMGSRKPNKEMFEEAVRRLGCRPEEIVLVDDLQRNGEAFMKLGGHWIQYDCRSDPPEKLESALAGLGLLK